MTTLPLIWYACALATLGCWAIGFREVRISTVGWALFCGPVGLFLSACYLVAIQESALNKTLWRAKE
jgi:hypothetical protein